jgi:hypothetical protein
VVCPGFILTNHLKKVAGLPGMGWLAERPLRRRNSAATDKSIPGYVLVFWFLFFIMPTVGIRVASPFVTFVQSFLYEVLVIFLLIRIIMIRIIHNSMGDTRSFTQFQDIAHLMAVFPAGEQGKGMG